MRDGRANIRFLGTGTAFNTDGRASQAILLEPPGRASILIDFGPDVMRSMMSLGLDPDRVDTLFLTHLHGDHFAGWPFLLLHWLFTHRRTRPVDVIGPSGTRERLEGVADLCYREFLSSRREFEVRYHELPIGEASQGETPDGVRFEALPLMHHPSSLGYRIDGLPGRLAISGDTEWCDNLVRLVSETDVAIIECTNLELAPGSHLSLDRIRRDADQLETARLVLTHLPDSVAASIAADPLAGAIAAYDGLTIEL